MKQVDFSNANEVQEYFNEIIKIMKGVRVVAVFSLGCASFSLDSDVRSYDEATSIYILFENEKCLVIDYYFIDVLKVSLRTLTDEEKTRYEEVLIKDFFNDTTTLYKMTPDKQMIADSIQQVSLEYDSLISVGLEYVTKPYSKWIDHSLVDEVAPKATTFEKITFTMANGHTFAIRPMDAIFDGYTLVWSDDAQETKTKV